MTNIENLLTGGDLRSIGKSNELVLTIKNQTHFDELFKYLYHPDRIIVMRAADAIEKITILNPAFLTKHKQEILDLCTTARNKELKWHSALLMPRLALENKELKLVWDILTQWALDKKESRIVRVNAIQGLYDLSKLNIILIKDLKWILQAVEKERIPSLLARIKRLR